MCYDRDVPVYLQRELQFWRLDFQITGSMSRSGAWLWRSLFLGHGHIISCSFSVSARITIRTPKMAALPRHSGLLQMGVLMVLLLFAAPAFSLVINTTTKGCSRECESQHCQDPFRLRYGKYCGVGYTGCDGEAACDGIDSCCLSHDHCVGSDLGNYVNRTCNDRLKHCVEQFQDANLPQFNGSTCSAKDLEDVIITSMNIATLGTSTGNISQLANLHRVTALVWLCVAFLLDN